MRKLPLVALCAALLVAVASPIRAETAPPVPADAEFGAKVRAYLLANPEVIVEALQAFQERTEKARASAAAASLGERRDDLVRDPASPVGGNPDGTVTVVEFFDYNCGFCKRAEPTVAELIARNPDVRYVYKEFPILAESSRYAARAALAVHRTQPELYQPFHRALLGNQGTLTEEAVRDIAGKVGVAVERMLAEMQSPAIAEALQANLELGQAIGVTGTPSFVIGDRLVAGAQPLPKLEEAVQAARAKEG